MNDYPQPLSFGEYDRIACSTDRFSGKEALLLSLQGLLGEAGSVLTAVKKHQRDASAFEAYKLVVLEELGDILWYLSSAARHSGNSLVDVAKQMPLSVLPARGDSTDIAFSDIYNDDLVEEYEEDPEYMDALADLGAQVGFLLSLPRDPYRSFEIRDQLAIVLGALIRVSHMSSLSLENITTYNARKILRRWPTAEFRVFDKDFDAAAPDYERLPESLSIKVQLIETTSGDYFVSQSINGVNVGDRLTDNISDPDFYRYHDVFHYAFAAVLHWSPVVRALLKLKRKFEPSIDQNEDGARAAIIEEAVSAYIFSRAKSQNFFEGVKPGQLSYDLLKAIADLTAGYEVEDCPPWLWEEAILQGYQAFRSIKERSGGLVHLNKTARTIKVEALQ